MPCNLGWLLLMPIRMNPGEEKSSLLNYFNKNFQHFLKACNKFLWAGRGSVFKSPVILKRRTLLTAGSVLGLTCSALFRWYALLSSALWHLPLWREGDCNSGSLLEKFSPSALLPHWRPSFPKKQIPSHQTLKNNFINSLLAIGVKMVCFHASPHTWDFTIKNLGFGVFPQYYGGYSG